MRKRFDGLTKRERAVILINELFDRYPEDEIDIDSYLEYESTEDGDKLIAVSHSVEIIKRF